MTTYHPDPQWLFEYVAGTLDDSQALCVSTHLSYCAKCEHQTATLTGVGAAMLNSNMPHSEPSPDALSRVLSTIDNAPAKEGGVRTPGGTSIDSGTDKLPPLIQKLVSTEVSDLPWKNIGSRISMARLNSLDGDREVALHRLQPGGSVSNHDHGGREITVVLQGSFSDQDGEYFPGDFLVREPGETHRPSASNNEECLCLAVCDAPVKFTGFFARLFNPLVAYLHRH